MAAKILIIEDDATIRSNLTDLLEEEGYEVITAAAAKPGLKLAKEESPDLIISDIILPDQDGFRILEEINKIKRLTAVPFIFLTAKADLQDLRRGMTQGAADYLTKPFDSAELLKVIKLRLEKAEEIKNHYQPQQSFTEPQQNSPARRDTGSHSSGRDSSGRQTPENRPHSKQLDENGRIVLMINGKPVFIMLGNIVSITAENVYTNVFLKDSKPLLVRRSMKEWEEMLPQNIFTRIHRGTIINSGYILKIEKLAGRNFKVFMKHSDQTYIISQRYALKLKNNIV
ncbi:MAG: LytR/AlgR family response regulator transcription factor [Bacillota bacterium]